MYAGSLFVLALAIFGASANLCGSCGNVGFGLNTVAAGNLGGFGNGVVVAGNGLGNGLGNGFGNGFGNGVVAAGNGFGNGVVSAGNVGVPAFQAPGTYTQTGVVEFPTAVVPSLLPTTSVSKSCHCVKTLVRPQVRNEYFTVPSVDRLTRVVTTPHVEVVAQQGNQFGSGKAFDTVVPNAGFNNGNFAFGGNLNGNGLSLGGNLNGNGVFSTPVAGSFSQGSNVFGGLESGVVGSQTGVVGTQTGVVGTQTGVVATQTGCGCGCGF